MQLKIHNLRFPAIIGIHDWERERERQFGMHITLEYDASAAIAGDDFTHAIDYGKIEAAALAYAASQPWNLIETLAHRTAEKLLVGFLQIQEITIAVEKPQAMDFAELVTATTTLRRSSH